MRSIRSTKRGTKSSASLMVAPAPVESMPRLRPPHHLVDEQVEIWQQIVNGHPADWFDAGSIAILAQLCRHIVISNRLAELVESTTDDNNLLLLILKEQRAESNEIRKLSTTLRITPQSITNHRGNKINFNTIATPWTRGASEPG